LDELQEELIDRFGLLPEAGQALLAVHQLRLDTKRFGIERLEAGPEVTSIQFISNPPVDPMKLIKLIQSRREFKLAGQDKLRIEMPCPTLEKRLALVRKFLAEIS
jgi:transcription-repair coupling factor (superfamily II helicase)